MFEKIIEIIKKEKTSFKENSNKNSIKIIHQKYFKIPEIVKKEKKTLFLKRIPKIPIKTIH